jgi:YD repeat-containing protein
MTRKVDGRGNDTLYTYNQLNQVVATQSEAPYRHTTYTFYDANDNIVQKSIENKVAAETDGKPVFTGSGNFATQPGSPGFFIDRYRYDILDRIVAQDLDASGSTPARLVTQYRYDANENRIRESLPAGNAMSSSYDERDLLLAMTRGAGTAEASTTRYSYNLNGNRVEVVDGRAMATAARYDGYDRHMVTIDAVGGQTTSRTSRSFTA